LIASAGCKEVESDTHFIHLLRANFHLNTQYSYLPPPSSNNIRVVAFVFLLIPLNNQPTNRLGTDHELSNELRRLLHRHLDFICHTRHAQRQTCRREVRQFDGRQSVRIVWKTRKTTDLLEFRTEQRHLRRVASRGIRTD
jgi:hypothetical protein